MNYSQPTITDMLQAAPNLQWRKCRECGKVSLHVDGITPWVLCRDDRCRSQNTHLLRKETAELRGEVER